MQHRILIIECIMFCIRYLKLLFQMFKKILKKTIGSYQFKYKLRNLEIELHLE